MPANVVVLGGGVGGTLAANLLSKRLGKDAKVTVVDPTGMHVYQPGFLYLALGQAKGRWLARDERTLLRKDIELVVDGASSVDPELKTVTLERGGSLPYDHLVIATGARLVKDEVPGLIEGSFDFYSMEGAHRLREELRRFDGGRIEVGIAGIPYKCPPAPVEFVFMLERELERRGIRDKSQIALLSPLNRAFTIAETSALVQPILAARGIELVTFFNVEAVDPATNAVMSLEGEKRETDLLVLVPPHRGQRFLETSGLTNPGGWVPVDRTTLEHTSQPDIYAIGDTTDLPISKSGSTAHFEAPVVASRIAAKITGRIPEESYGGRVMCFLETGKGKATTIRFDYDSTPFSPKPGRIWHWAKWVFNRLYWHTLPQGRIPESIGRPKPSAIKGSSEGGSD